MTTPNYPQQPGPYGPPPGGQPQQPYGQPPQQPYTPSQGMPQQGGYPGDAYAQPQGQPMGQPGQPGPYGPPPGDPYGPPPGQMPPGQPMPYGPQPPKKKSSAGKIIGSIVAFVLVAGGVIVVKALIGGGLSAGLNSITEPSAKPGDCASVTGTTISPKYKKVDCGSTEANYFIAKAMNSTTEACPSEDYAEYTESGRRSSSLKLCLVEKLEEGKCYQEEIVKINMEGMKAVACPATPNEFAITKILKIEKVVKAATAECGEATAISYAEPPPGITYCVTAVEGK